MAEDIKTVDELTEGMEVTVTGNGFNVTAEIRRETDAYVSFSVDGRTHTLRDNGGADHALMSQGVECNGYAVTVTTN